MSFSHLCLGFSLFLSPASIPCIFIKRTKIFTWPNELSRYLIERYICNLTNGYFVVKWVNNRAADKYGRSAKIIISVPRWLCEMYACPPALCCRHRIKRHATYVNDCFIYCVSYQYFIMFIYFDQCLNFFISCMYGL